MEARFIYGTAWKKDQTADLVYRAIVNGFRSIDTAAQPRHYREEEVGNGIRAAIRDGLVSREDLIIQSKFTWISGQDPGTQPYDSGAPIHVQTRQSVERSLFHLRPRIDKESAQDSYIDVVFLHFPLPTLEQTLAAWTTLQAYCPARIRRLGISNTSLPIIQVLFRARSVTIRPSLIQNRLQRENNYDQEIRDFCRAENLSYQCFGVLKSNAELLQSTSVQGLAADARVSLETALYFLVLDLGKEVTVLNGTKDIQRMRQDGEEITRLRAWAAEPTNLAMLKEKYCLKLEPPVAHTVGQP